MHAVNQITPGTLVAIIIGIILCMAIYRAIFKKRR